MRVSKKAVTVHAWEFPDISREATVETGSDEPAKVPYWVLIAIARGQVVFSIEATHVVETKQGPQSAVPGDWLIRGAEGELYPCTCSEFDKTYEFEPVVAKRSER